MFNRIFFILLLLGFISGCGVETPKTELQKSSGDVTQSSQTGATIEIIPNSPADTVRAFYKNLHEGKLREAIFLTNLRPAIEGLTDSELKDLQVDFDALAEKIPGEIQINGEIISGEKATVTANVPEEKTDQVKTHQIRLKRENDVWILQMVGSDAEKQVKKEGKSYFFTLRIETHHEEVREILDTIRKAEIAHAVQNQGAFADIETLVSKNLLIEDMRKAEVGGYKYKVYLPLDRKNYSVTAEPVSYGKSGKLSFLAEVKDGKDLPLKSKDTGGRSLKLQ